MRRLSWKSARLGTRLGLREGGDALKKKLRVAKNGWDVCCKFCCS